VGKLGKDDQSHVEKRLVAHHRLVDQLQHPIDPAGNLVAMGRVGLVELARSGVVTLDRRHSNVSCVKGKKSETQDTKYETNPNDGKANFKARNSEIV
jgi:hypothetical protein